MGFSISTTVGEVTYAVEADDFGTFVHNMAQVGGLYGFVAAVQDETEKAAFKTVKDVFPNAEQVDESALNAPVATPGVSDELADLIRGAPDLRALAALYKAHKDAWNSDYNKLAGERRKQLEKAAK